MGEYQDAVDWLFQVRRFGPDRTLDPISRLSELLGDPQNRFKAIHIGGTNGKGSTSAMIASILRAAGFSVGLFTSPHLERFTERIVVDGEEIPEKDIVRLTKLIRPIVERLDSQPQRVHPLFFDIVTALAFKYFEERHVDFAVLEVGLGGRLDATNIVNPLVSVITNISLEHTQVLGDTVLKIAYEKAGIIKSGPCISGSGNEAIRRRAREVGVPLYVYEEDFECEEREVNSEKTGFDYVGKERIEGLELAMLGKFQVRNAGLAVRAAEELGIGEESIRKGLKKAKLRGRLEVLCKEPLVVADVAHNPGGASALVESLGVFGERRKIIVFGCMKDKEWRDVLKILARVADRFIFAKADMERAEEPEKLLEEGRKYCESEIAESIGEAVGKALEEAGEGDMVLVTGSLYIMKEAYKEVGAL